MYEFRNDHYIASHEKAPRGKGWWMFEDRHGGLIANIQGLHTLTEAKKLVVKQLKENGIKNAVIYVAP